jgi:DNA-binding NarL/FixJ family response regulator
LSLIAVHQEDYARAQALLEAQARLCHEQGEWQHACELHLLGRIASAEGRPVDAATHYQQSLTCFHRLGDSHSLAVCLEGLAEVVVAQGQPMKAAYMLGCAEAIRETIHAVRPPILQKRYEATAVILVAQLGEYAFLEASRQGQQMQPNTLFPVAAHDDALSLPPASHQSAAAGIVPSGPATPSSPSLPEALTEREVEVFRLLASGLTKPQIAERLTLSFHTVNAHVRSIYAKLGVSSRSAAIRYALEHALV